MIRLTITGNPTTKKNHRPIFISKKTGKRFIAKSETLRQYEQATIWQLKSAKRKIKNVNLPISTEVNITYAFYLPTKRKVDLSNLIEAPQDCLQEAGIIKDDSLIVDLKATKHYSKEDPRTEITIEEYQGCLNCQYFSETIDDYQCWKSGSPVSISIREDCKDWEK
jgi:Holliday junction resolvase RusA-like endonuclease